MQIATARAIKAAVTEKVWGEYVSGLLSVNIVKNLFSHSQMALLKGR